MKKLLSVLAGAAMVPAVAFSPVTATGMGQVEGGDIYRVKNVTKNVDFANATNATCGETVQFKVRIHNPGPSALQNVSVTATLPGAAATSHVSKVTVSSPYADPTSTSDTATVNLDKSGKLVYVAGSTELLGADNGKLSTLGDTVTTSGVNIGNVGVSINEKRYVQFQAKVECPTTPVTPTTPETPKTPEAPKTLGTQAPAVIAATGPAETFVSLLGLSSLAAAVTYFVRSRRANILG